MWLKQPGRQVGPGAPDLQALCSGPAHILWPLGFWFFFCTWVWVGWKHKAAFFPCWGPLINFSPDLWVFIFPFLFLFFLSCFHPFLGTWWYFILEVRKSHTVSGVNCLGLKTHFERSSASERANDWDPWNANEQEFKQCYFENDLESWAVTLEACLMLYKQIYTQLDRKQKWFSHHLLSAYFSVIFPFK